MQQSDYQKIAKLLDHLGISSWVSGGTARDLFLGKEPNAHDIAVCATLEDLKTKLDDKIVSINNYKTSATIKYFDKVYILYPLKIIKADNTYYTFKYVQTIQEDSGSRDLTINALYYNPLTDTWLDPQDGIRDIKNKQIRLIGNPEDRILESNIRLLRVSILHNILSNDGDWTIANDTAQVLEKLKLRVITIPPYQIAHELNKLFLRANSPSQFFKSLRDQNILIDFFPELHNTQGIEQTNKAANLDLFEHIMATLDAVKIGQENTLVLRLAALLHDIGKPYTQTADQSGLHFYNHDRVGAALSTQIMKRWGYSSNLRTQVETLVANHLFDAKPNKSASSLKKLIHKVGPDQIHNLLDLRIADRLGTKRDNINNSNIEFLRDEINQFLSVIKPKYFKLNLSDSEIQDILSSKIEYVEDATIEAKQYLKAKILNDTLINHSLYLKRELQELMKIDCPLGLEHLFKTWGLIEQDNVETFPDGKLSCGIFCNFLCNQKYLKK